MKPRGLFAKQKTFITNNNLIAEQNGSGAKGLLNNNGGSMVSDTKLKKQKTISLSKLRSYQLNKASHAASGVEP